MKFWRGNKLDAEFGMEPAEVAALFYKALAAGEMDLRLKWDYWPRTRVLRDWMTAHDAFNASWEDEDGFEQILDALEETAPPGSLGICPNCGGEYSLQSDGTLPRHNYALPGCAPVDCRGTRPKSWRF